MRRRVAPIIAAVCAVVTLSLSACVGVESAAPSPVPTVTVTVTVAPTPEPVTSAESEAYAKQATCALADAGISLLEAGGSAAQAFAALVAENVVEGRIKELAEQVRDGSDTAEIRQELTQRLAAYCDVE